MVCTSVHTLVYSSPLISSLQTKFSCLKFLPMLNFAIHIEFECIWGVTDLNAFDRRKKKAVHKTTTTDDKRLQSTLKRIGVNAIPAIEEVNIFKDDIVIQFLNPKGNTCFVKGLPTFIPIDFFSFLILFANVFFSCFSSSVNCC